jgi:hypothetical protein
LTWASALGFTSRLKFLSLGKDPDEVIDEPPPAARPTDGEQQLIAPAATPSETSPAAGKKSVPQSELPAEADEEAIATAVLGLKTELGHYRGAITAIDARLRDCATAPDEPTVRACAEKLRNVNDRYLEQQETHRERLSAEGPNDEAASAAVREVADAADRQAAVVASVQAELVNLLGPEADLLAQFEQMLGETRQISQTSDELDAALGTALAAIGPKSIDALSASAPAAVAGPRREFVAQIEH